MDAHDAWKLIIDTLVREHEVPIGMAYSGKIYIAGEYPNVKVLRRIQTPAGEERAIMSVPIDKIINILKQAGVHGNVWHENGVWIIDIY